MGYIKLTPRFIIMKQILFLFLIFNFFNLIPNTALCMTSIAKSPYKTVAKMIKPNQVAKSPYKKSLRTPYKRVLTSNKRSLRTPYRSTSIYRKAPIAKASIPIAKVSKPINKVYLTPKNVSPKPLKVIVPNKPIKSFDEYPIVPDYFTYTKENIALARSVKQEDPKFYQEMYQDTEIYDYLEGKNRYALQKKVKKQEFNLKCWLGNFFKRI